jgi:hypothetical protein
MATKTAASARSPQNAPGAEAVLIGGASMRDKENLNRRKDPALATCDNPE